MPRTRSSAVTGGRTTAGRAGRATRPARPSSSAGTDESGARTVLLGSEPLFRAHPKGQYALVARALIWSALDG